MSDARARLRGALWVWRRLRFRLWALRLDLELRRHGGRLVLDAPHGARFGSPPRIRTHPLGDGDGTFTLSLGRNVDLGHDLYLEIWARGTNRFELGDETYCRSNVQMLFGSGSIAVAHDSRIRDFAVLRTYGELYSGSNSSIGYGATLHCTERIRMGDMVGIAERVTILDSDHLHDGSDVHHQAQPLLVEPVELGRNALVGANAIILRGARIGRNAFVASGALVRGGDYPAGWLIAGVPAKAVKALPKAPTPNSEASEKAPSAR